MKNKLNIKNIDELVYSMLTENTGTHFLDSGGADGRHWQGNQKKTLDDFKNEKKVSYDVFFDDNGNAKLEDINVTISLFHYMLDVFELDNICNDFNKKFNVMSDYESNYNFISLDAQEYLESLGFEKHNEKINTYNYDNYLSQNVLFTHLKLNDDHYYLVSIHNGADVRGGYTDAKLFKLNYYVDLAFYSFCIYGSVNDIYVSNTYNGYSLTIDDTNETETDTDTFTFDESVKIDLEYSI